MLTSFTNFITLILNFKYICYLTKLTLKKKYKISDINDLCNIFSEFRFYNHL